MFLHHVLALGEEGHRAATPLEELPEELPEETDDPCACCELSHDRYWSGGRATTWKNICEW
jgi:hypothetical protein